MNLFGYTYGENESVKLHSSEFKRGGEEKIRRGAGNRELIATWKEDGICGTQSSVDCSRPELCG